MADLEQSAPQPREILLTVAGLIALSLAYVNVWYNPREIEIKRDQKILEEAQKKLKADEDLIASLNSSDKPAEQQLAQDARLATIREANNNFTNIVKKLSGNENPDLFMIRSLTLDKEEQFSEYNKVQFTLDVEAPFLNVGQFLEKLEESLLLTELVDIDATRIDPELKRCSVKLSLNSYVSRM
jgi:hypothetical protein